jgi:hypothetical protein
MLVEVLLDVELGVHYGFLTLCSAQTQEDDNHDRDAWRGQNNGLIGAVVPEMLRIRTVTHTGQVRVRIELHDVAPELAADWPEVVEVWFANWVDDLTLTAFDDVNGPISLPPGSYQVRYATRTISGSGGEPDVMSVAEECVLQFWPATGVDRIVRQTGQAASWHRNGTEPPWTAAELAARVDELRTNRKLYEEEPPDDPDDEPRPAGWPYHWLVQSLGDAGRAVGYVDPSLAAHLTTAEPATLRAIACWALEQALIIAEIRDIPGFDEAVAAVRRGDDLPPHFADRAHVYGQLPSADVDLADPDAAAHHRRAWAERQAVDQLYRATGPIDMEATCAILDTAGTLRGGSSGWILAAVRHVFPHLVPADS